MRVVIFGATGMVGQGVLRECLLSNDVEEVLCVGRNSVGQRHEKLTEIIERDLFNLSAIKEKLSGYDGCFFCVGVSSFRMKESDYRHLTYDLTLSIARLFAEQSSQAAFIYVSGQGTDSPGKGRVMWARVKGETENAIAELPLGAYAFRPGFIQPQHGMVSKTTMYRILYAVLSPLFPLLRIFFPKSTTTTEKIGKAMINVVKTRPTKKIWETTDINAI